MDPTATAAVEPTPIQSMPGDRFSFSTYLLSFAAGMILYALSPGPVAKCLKPRSFSALITPSPLDQVIDTTYAPLIYCYDHSLAVHRFYDWYVGKIWRAE